MSDASTTLVPHPRTPRTAVTAISVDLHLSRARELHLRYLLDGDVAGLRVPPPAPPAIVSGLWEHTCFEAFVGIAGEPGYRELNLSPSRAWALHEFRDYRDGGLLADAALAPEIAVAASTRALELTAIVPLARWPPAYHDAELQLGLAAVVETADGTRSYWALRHPADRPDFHHAEARTVRLSP
jgi:hypothetical protein